MTFWASETTESNPNTFSLTATTPACVGPPEAQFFMGGVAMAAAVEAAEQTIGRPMLWATIQFLSHGMLGDDIEISVHPLGGGRNISMASVDIRCGDRLLQKLSAALGGRKSNESAHFVNMPDVRPPHACPPKVDDVYASEENLLSQFERRTAFEDNDNGIEYMWIRPLFDAPISPALLALISDFFLGAHSRTRGGTSLDNTFRMIELKQSDWVLNVTQLSAFQNGVVHGNSHQFATDGQLLSTSSQSGLLPRAAD